MTQLREEVAPILLRLTHLSQGATTTREFGYFQPICIRLRDTWGRLLSLTDELGSMRGGRRSRRARHKVYLRRSPEGWTCDSDPRTDYN